MMAQVSMEIKILSSVRNFQTTFLKIPQCLLSFKLSEDNFLIWKQHVLSAVRGYGLEGYLTGEQAAPPQTITSKNSTQQRPNPDFLNWNMQDQRLTHWIQSSLSETIMILVVGLSTSHEIWQALEKSFAHQSRAKAVQDAVANSEERVSLHACFLEPSQELL